jgi:glucose/arabinose dehydrogenase
MRASITSGNAFSLRVAAVIAALTVAHAGCSSSGSSGGKGGSGAVGSAGTTGAAGDNGTAGTGGDVGSGGGAGTGDATGTGGGAGATGTAGAGGAGGATASAGAGGIANGGRGGTGGQGARGGTTGSAGTMGSGGSGTCSGPGSLKLTTIASGFTTPVYVTQPAGETRMFVVEQVGRIRIISNGAVLATPFLDARASSLGDPPMTDGEQGLLGLAFHPQYASNGRFFVFYNRRSSDPFTTGSQGDIVVAEGARSSNADVASPTLKPLFVIPQTHGHTGGMLGFGPDGNLYIASGDATDPTNSPNPNSKYGKILRVDVGSAAPATPNLVPAVAYLGLRNPWRFSFDRANGDLYIADVGEHLREEIDYVPAGTTAVLNFGWPTMEGTLCSATGCSMTGLTLPVYDYGRDAGQVVIGGFVYRGSKISCLRGRYLFADYNSGGFWSFLLSSGQATGLLDHTNQINMREISSFGEDAAGEIYVTVLDPGVVYRLDPG